MASSPRKNIVLIIVVLLFAAILAVMWGVWFAGRNADRSPEKIGEENGAEPPPFIPNPNAGRETSDDSDWKYPRSYYRNADAKQRIDAMLEIAFSPQTTSPDEADYVKNRFSHEVAKRDREYIAILVEYIDPSTDMGAHICALTYQAAADVNTPELKAKTLELIEYEWDLAYSEILGSIFAWAAKYSLTEGVPLIFRHLDSEATIVVQAANMALQELTGVYLGEVLLEDAEKNPVFNEDLKKEWEAWWERYGDKSRVDWIKSATEAAVNLLDHTDVPTRVRAYDFIGEKALSKAAGAVAERVAKMDPERDRTFLIPAIKTLGKCRDLSYEELLLKIATDEKKPYDTRAVAYSAVAELTGDFEFLFADLERVYTEHFAYGIVEGLNRLKDERVVDLYNRILKEAAAPPAVKRYIAAGLVNVYNVRSIEVLLLISGESQIEQQVLLSLNTIKKDGAGVFIGFHERLGAPLFKGGREAPPDIGGFERALASIIEVTATGEARLANDAIEKGGYTKSETKRVDRVLKALFVPGENGAPAFNNNVSLFIDEIAKEVGKMAEEKERAREFEKQFE